MPPTVCPWLGKSFVRGCKVISQGLYFASPRGALSVPERELSDPEKVILQLGPLAAVGLIKQNPSKQNRSHIREGKDVAFLPGGRPAAFVCREGVRCITGRVYVSEVASRAGQGPGLWLVASPLFGSWASASRVFHAVLMQGKDPGPWESKDPGRSPHTLAV